MSPDDVRLRAVTHPRQPARATATRARSWWGKAWVRAVEESSYADSDLTAARALVRAGRVGPVTIDVGRFFAAVEDDPPGAVTVRVPPLDPSAVELLVELVAAESGRVASLVAGELPHALVEQAEEGGVELLPYGGELEAGCTCAAWVDPCRHALAVALAVTWLVEADPMVLMHLRGLPREELLARLHELSATPGEAVDDLETGLEATLRAQRILSLLDEPGRPVDHLF